MYKAAAALKTFFSGFDLPAYTVDSVPDNAQLPYITSPGCTRTGFSITLHT